MNAIHHPVLNPLKKKLDANEPGVGILVTMPSVHMVQALTGAGFDWLFIDMEHGPIGIESAHAMITATQGSNATPIVRVPWNEAWLIKPVLDAGAMGVIVPMIRSRDDAAAAVRAVRYPPSGERGFGPFYASMRFNTAMIEYPDPADREIQLVLLIEHKDAIDDIERIVELDGIDVCFIAPFDLAMSYGYRDGVDYPEVKDGVARAEKAILASGIHLGGLALDTDAANAMIERGYRLILTGFDTMLIARSAAAIIDGIKRPSSTETQ